MTRHRFRTTARPPGARRVARGFTLGELLVTIVLAGVVLASVLKLLTNQARAYEKQRENGDTQETIRGASAVLGWELRQAALAGSAPSAIAAGDITFRSLTATGVVCSRHPSQPRIGIARTAGTWTATADDSAMIWQVGRSRWRQVKIKAIGTPAGLGVLSCNKWSGTQTPDIVMEIIVAVPADTQGVFAGAPVRAFQQVRYSEFFSGNRWWLGRKVGQAASWDQLTGPLLAPSENGLAFTYYDSSGVVTAVPAKVAAIQFTLLAQSTNTAAATGLRSFKVDTVSTRVALRR
jgi:prepilin-type N-terminal cleavage/methylation domain-containing protein